MKMLRRARRAKTMHGDQEGLAMLFWVLSFIGLLAFLAIVVETGFILLERRDLQNTADAAALAGARQLFSGDFTQAEVDARTWADKNAVSLGRPLNATSTYVAGPNADPTLGDTITATVRRNSQGLFNTSSFLSFGKPEVSAVAAARLATSLLPGPGVFCIGVESSEHDVSLATQALLGDPVGTVDYAGLDPGYLTILKIGADAATANAGFIDIIGGGPNGESTRECLENGSSGDLAPVENTQTGQIVGPGRQGIQARLEAAAARNCADWDDVVQSILDARAANDGTWRCSPLTDQASAVVLMPVF